MMKIASQFIIYVLLSLVRKYKNRIQLLQREFTMQCTMILSFDGQNTKLIKTLCIAVSQLLKIWLQVSDTLNQSTRSYFCKPSRSHIRVNNTSSSLLSFLCGTNLFGLWVNSLTLVLTSLKPRQRRFTNGLIKLCKIDSQSYYSTKKMRVVALFVSFSEP